MAYVGKKAKRARKKSQGPRVTPSKGAIPNNIKVWRLKRMYTQDELAEMVGVTRVSISNWEAGLKAPNDTNKVALCKALNCSISDLFQWEV